jgi:maleamate amidohydrolase
MKQMAERKDQSVVSGRRHVWDDIVDDEIRTMGATSGTSQGLGNRPALLCIDNYNAVFGDRLDQAPPAQ